MSSGEVLILASVSSRRRELLAECTARFVVQPCPLDEPPVKPVHLPASDWAEALAYFKARAVAEGSPGCWVLGADTVVVCAGQMLGKPTDAADALRMLRMQAGRVSEVITGISLVRINETVRRILRHEVTRVWMRDDAAAIAAYVDGDQWRGKAGAYGIQDVGDRLVERIEGSFSNVVGLPLERLAKLLAAIGRPAKTPLLNNPLRSA